MARLVGPLGQVFAFEPVPWLCDCLSENLRLNPSLQNAVAVQLALSDLSGLVPFYTGHHTGAGHLAVAGGATGEQLLVESDTLDEFVFEGHHQPPAFIKIDVEGAEGRVLAGAERLLRTVRPKLLVDLHTPEQDMAVGRVLAGNGYEAYATRDGRRVRDLSSGWPDPEGLWGQFIAFPIN